VAASGSAASVWRLRDRGWKQVEGIGPKLVHILTHADDSRASQTVSECRRLGLHLLCPEDDGYPERLKVLDDAPLVLFARGETGCLNHSPMLATVGARRASREGKLVARRWCRHLSQRGVCIVSGMAFGVDAAAHRGCLEGTAPTIAVLGCGLAVETGQQQQRQKDAIAGQGCVVSEFLPDTGPRPEHFPRRNRVIAGLAEATLVIEAGLKSGTLITASHAASYGREVLAVPGPVMYDRHAGCHQLIRDGATLVESADDVLTAMHWQQQGKAHKRAAAYAPATEDEAHIIAALKHQILHIDRLAEGCGLTVPELSPILIALELAGVVACLAGSRYTLADEE